MADVYESMLSSNVGRSILSSLNLPVPTELERHSQAQTSFVTGNVLIGAAPGGRMAESIASTLKNSAASVQVANNASALPEIKAAAEKAELKLTEIDVSAESAKFKALVFDATGIENSEQTKELYDFFHPVIRKLHSSARVVIVGLPPESCKANPRQQIAQRALEGLVRSIGKEIGKKGATANLVYVAKQAEKAAESALRFFLSPKSAFVDAQVLRVSKAKAVENDFNWNLPLTDKVVLVTGASRGIGEAIAGVMARDGAKVVCLDVPQAKDNLQKVADRLNGGIIAIDITDPEAPAKIANTLKTEYGGVDVVVHNAGVTRDKTLGGMPPHMWEMVININLSAEERINDALLESETINPGGRIVCVSSMSGIAGNFGQSNYAVSKAGVIGMVDAFAPILAKKDITINAVAPGFIETQMTAAIPFATREAGRRLNSLKQGGLPVDVAEAIAFYSSPASAGVNGNTIRVCGQNLLGA
ncbi:3-oxoacyl-ACP reductase [Ketobacter sp. MCCC 1A13808]|uniref:3-oxoacyl-ACP reductase n=1 Tax=Ketobacter sp. MCCC 1A13808 TaxID=2602738 RepID=UPI0012EB51F0|nr:3-oxoacyl-ACP reductase [Ketobacter sp. MCCC 1A13808]MVF10962.1 3-oxoacyl-ACP reductase [Ketobacter sp. MCCC 1A13808]